jgi:hypothetical protein
MRKALGTSGLAPRPARQRSRCSTTGGTDVTDGFAPDIKDSKPISGVDQPVAGPPLPRGGYTGRAVAGELATGVVKVDPAGEARLAVGQHEDRARSFSRAEGAAA